MGGVCAVRRCVRREEEEVNKRVTRGEGRERECVCELVEGKGA
jgi:hypothetical protein